MSTKTLRKRIALVAVASMGAAVLSVAPASATAPNDLAVNDITISTTAATTPGVCSITTTSGAQAIVLVSGTSFVLTTTSGANGESAVATVAGNATIASVSGWDAATLTSASSTASPYAATNDTLTVKAGAVGSATVTFSSTSTSAAVDVVSVTVVASCANNVLSMANSFVKVGAIANATSNIDDSAYTTVANGSTTYININLKDAYDNGLTGSGVLLATATNGAVIAWDGAPSVQSSTAYLATRGVANTELYVTQGTANADKPLSTTVSITLDGVAVATKTLTFTGIPAKIKISNVAVGKVGSTGVFDAQVLDAAGNALGSKTVATDSVANGVAAVAAIASISTSAVTGSDGSATSSTVGTRGAFSCTKSGATTLTVKTVISSVAGTSVGQSFPVICGGALDTWTLSMDKKTYAPGEIATLTVKGKDSYGFAVNSTDTLGTLEYSFGGLTAVTAPTSADKFTAGAKTYTFAVGTSEGAFVGTFKIAGATDTDAKTVQYTVSAGTAGTSNAAILKAIVSLIASINKQIALLQKALLKK